MKNLTSSTYLLVLTLSLLLSSIASAQASPSIADTISKISQHDFHDAKSMTHDRQLKKSGIADLDDQDWKVRTLALRDFVKAGDTGIPDLITALAHQDPQVRYLAAAALGIQASQKAIPALEETLQSAKESIVRSQAAISLGLIGSKQALPDLTKALNSDASRDVIHQCELSIYQIQTGQKASPALREAYASLDESTFETLQLNQAAPDFSLLDSEGKPWKLSDYKGKKTVLLIWVFADWCPVCHSEFRELMHLRENFQNENIEVVTIEIHDRYRCRVMVGKEVDPKHWFSKKSFKESYTKNIWWPHLSDKAGAVAATYGVDPLCFAVHSEYINRPSTVIIDKKGVVRFAYYGTYFGDRPSIKQTFNMIKNKHYQFEHPKRLQLP
ncbi:MAG: redoxin domain-containing protein [Verrucomicrobiales bacterium]|nr:redoxin domain-containing protein [Verrucomicrobiales bacterium]